MKHAENMKTFFKNATIRTNPAQDRAVLADALGAGGLAGADRPVGGRTKLWRSAMRHPIPKLALAAAVVVAAVIGIYTVGGSRPAFADVVKPILAARTAVYTIIASRPDKPVFKVQGEFMEPGLTRYTIGPAEEPDKELIQVITDQVQGKRLTLIPSQKTAMVTDLEKATGELDPRVINMFTELRRRILLACAHGDESITCIGDSKIDGRPVFGYRFVEDDMRVTLWADAASFLPVQIEYTMADEPADRSAEAIMMDIQFDVPLDPAAFSLAVPLGYHEQTVPLDGSPTTEADLVVLLQFYAEATQGRLPSKLDISAFKELAQAVKGTALKDTPNLADPAGPEVIQKAMQNMMKMARGLRFVMTLPPGADWHYTGATATFGDATKPIFWYRPSGSATYRVIYADLSIRDVAPANLPK
jgi:hypothetical protein